jgi:hypothetical protein
MGDEVFKANRFCFRGYTKTCEVRRQETARLSGVDGELVRGLMSDEKTVCFGLRRIWFSLMNSQSKDQFWDVHVESFCRDNGILTKVVKVNFKWSPELLPHFDGTDPLDFVELRGQYVEDLECVRRFRLDVLLSGVLDI